MKNKLYSPLKWLISYSVMIIFFACSDFDIDTQPGAGIHLDTDALKEYTCLAKQPDKIMFNVSSTTPWKIKMDPEVNWCKVSPSMSSMSALTSEVTIALDENTQYSGRRTRLTLKADQNDSVYYIDVIQNKKTSFEYQPYDEIIPTEGGAFTFTIKTNQAWTVRSEKQWISFDKSLGEGVNDIEVITAIAEMNSGSTRNSKIYLSNGEEEVCFTVTQSGYMMDFEGVTDNKDEFAPNGGEKIYRIISSLPWKATCDDPSVFLTKINGNELNVKIRGNNLFGKKKIEITLSPESPLISGQIQSVLEISQNTNFYYDGAAGNVIFNDNGSVVLNNQGAVKSRMVTTEVYGLGTYIWKFSSVHVEGKGYFDINAYPKSGNANYHIYLGQEGGNKITSGGTVLSQSTGSSVDFWASAKNFNLSATDLNNMKELRLTVLPALVDEKKLVIELYLNGILLCKDDTRINIWSHLPSHGLQMHFGFVNGLSGSSSFAIESFDIIPFVK